MRHDTMREYAEKALKKIQNDRFESSENLYRARDMKITLTYHEANAYTRFVYPSHIQRAYSLRLVLESKRLVNAQIYQFHTTTSAFCRTSNLAFFAIQVEFAWVGASTTRYRLQYIDFIEICVAPFNLER